MHSTNKLNNYAFNIYHYPSMRYKSDTKYLAFITAILLLGSCAEMPNEPNFTTENTLQIPLTTSKKFTLIGQGNDVLIDTTSADFEDVFDFDTDANSPTYGLVSIGQVEKVDDIDLNDAIPSIDLAPSNISSQIGKIDIDNIDLVINVSSEEILGFVPSGNVIIPISFDQVVEKSFDVDGLTSFTIDSGGFSLSVTNNTGIDYTEVQAQLFAATTPIGNSIVFENFSNGQSLTRQILFSQGDEAIDLNIRFTLTAPAQQSSGPYESLTTTIDPLNLSLSAAELSSYRLENQSFNSIGTIDFNNDGVNFSSADHFILLSEGQIRISEITNSLAVGLENLTIASDFIIAPNGETFKLSFKGDSDGSDGLFSYRSIQPNELPRSRGDIIVDLSGYRIKAFDAITGIGDAITYSVEGSTPVNISSTESTQFTENSSIQTVLGLENLKISEVFAQINQNEFTLKNDQNNDGVIGLLTNGEFESTIIDAFDDIRDELANVELKGSTLNFDFSYNIGVETHLFLAIVGLDINGNELYLSSSDYSVNETDLQTRSLFRSGQAIPIQRLIKIVIEPAANNSLRAQRISFTASNSNVEDFINLLPSEIRFVGRAIASPNGGVGRIVTPLQFDASFAVEVPLSIIASSSDDNPRGAAFTPIDIDIDLTDLPNPEEDDSRITKADLIINYENGLPITLDFGIDFLRADSSLVFSYPEENQSLLFKAASYDQITGFANGKTQDQILFSLNQTQLDLLNQVEILQLTPFLKTEQYQARPRYFDELSFEIRAGIVIQNSIGN